MFDSHFLIVLFIAYHSFFSIGDYDYDDAVPTVFCYIVYQYLKSALNGNAETHIFLSPSTFEELGVSSYHLYNAIRYLCRKGFITRNAITHAYPNRYIYCFNIHQIYQQRKTVPIIQELLRDDGSH